jgi:hypothetical protein
MATYQELVDCQWHLVFRARDSNCVTRFLCAREGDLAVELLLELVNLVETGNELSMVQAVDVDRLGDEFCIGLLNHVHNLLLHKIEILGVTCWRTADDVVDFDVILLLAVTAAVHSVRKLHKDGVLLHDALDVLTTNSDDALVVLVRHVE